MGGFSTIWGSPPLPIVTIAAGSNSYPAGRHLGDGAGLNHVEPNLLPANIIAGLNIFGTLGTHGYFDRWVPATLMLADAQAIVTVDKADNEPALLTSQHVEDYEDGSTNLKMLTPAITMPDAETIEAVDASDDEVAAVHTHYDIQQVLEGAVADDGGATTDETAAAKNATANDMTLLPATPALNDAYYFGSDYLFDALILNIGIGGAGVWDITWEYYDGGAWQALGGITDGTTHFRAAPGSRSVTFTRGAGWATVAVGGITKYWIRARVSAYTSIVTQPKGTQAWYKITT